MKKSFIILSLCVAALCSCQKNEVAELSDGPKEIVLSAYDAMDMEVSTKAVTDLTTSGIASGTIYVSASTGTAGSAEAAFSALANKTVTLSSGKGSTGVYWPATGTLNFYASNLNNAKSIAASGCTMSVSLTNGVGTADHVAGFSSSVANGTTTVSIAMNHIYARLYDIQFKTKDSGATATVSAVSITPQYSAGTYNFRSNVLAGSTTNSTATSLTAPSASFTSSASSMGQSNVDRVIIPGTVKVTVTYTITRTGYSKTYTSSALTTSKALVQGKKTTLTLTLGDDASGITIQPSISDWGTDSITGQFN